MGYDVNSILVYILPLLASEGCVLCLLARAYRNLHTQACTRPHLPRPKFTGILFILLQILIIIKIKILIRPYHCWESLSRQFAKLHFISHVQMKGKFCFHVYVPSSKKNLKKKENRFCSFFLPGSVLLLSLSLQNYNIASEILFP